MAEDKNAEGNMQSHPLWEDYQETMEIIREVRPKAEDGDEIANERLDILEDRATDLTNRMSKDLGIPDKRRDNPLYQEWDEKWKDLRTAKRENRQEEEETIWEELKKVAEKIEMQSKFSEN